jgi:hypothetical protein
MHFSPASWYSLPLLLSQCTPTYCLRCVSTLIYSVLQRLWGSVWSLLWMNSLNTPARCGRHGYTVVQHRKAILRDAGTMCNILLIAAVYTCMYISLWSLAHETNVPVEVPRCHHWGLSRSYVIKMAALAAMCHVSIFWGQWIRMTLISCQPESSSLI